MNKYCALILLLTVTSLTLSCGSGSDPVGSFNPSQSVRAQTASRLNSRRRDISPVLQSRYLRSPWNGPFSSWRRRPLSTR